MENLSSASVKPNATITATRIKPMKLRRAQPSAIKASLKGRSWSGGTAGILGRVWVYWMQNPGGHLVLCLHLFLILLWQFSGFTPALWLLNYLGSSKWALVRKQESVDNWIGVFFFPPPILSRQRPSPGCSGLSPYSDSSTLGPSYQNNKLIFQSFQTGPAPVKVSYTVREQCHFSASVSLDKVNQNLN